MKVLTISDVEVNLLYNPRIRERFTGVDVILSCGDLPYYYLEFILSMLDVPLFYVNGNHHNQMEDGAEGSHRYPWGGYNLNRRVKRDGELLLAGIEGSILYNKGPCQYSQESMWWAVLSLVPGLLLNRLRFGRSLDVLISHAPPRGIQDAADQAHQGVNAFRWLLKVFRPQYHFHGHTHVYRTDLPLETLYCRTRVVNTYGYRVTEIFPGRLRPAESGVLQRGW